MLSQELVYIRQIEIAAEDAARMRLEGLTTLAFDESLVGAAGPPLPGDYSSFSSPANFGFDFNDSGIPDDFDDYHGRTDSIFHVVSADSFWFVVSYSVNYLTTAGDTTSTPTETKEATINIQSMTPIGTRQVTGVFSKTTLMNDNF